MSDPNGFGNPPKKNRFKPGQSGNPKGRPKGSRNFATVFHEISKKTVKVKDNDGTRYVSKIDAAITQLANKAASGDLKVIKEFLRLTQSLPDLAALRPQLIKVVFVDPEDGKEISIGVCKG